MSEDALHLRLEGILHVIALTPCGSDDDPWPFLLCVSDGNNETSATIRREDAEALISFLATHLVKPSETGA